MMPNTITSKHAWRRKQSDRPSQERLVGPAREPRHRESEQRVQHEDVACPDEERMHGADRQQDPQAALEPRERRFTAARQLQAEADAKSIEKIE
jgi:hypothetical protein